jgi:hypothetical protein
MAGVIHPHEMRITGAKQHRQKGGGCYLDTQLYLFFFFILQKRETTTTQSLLWRHQLIKKDPQGNGHQEMKLQKHQCEHIFIFDLIF